MVKVLVTGGAGYIGSHTCLSLLEDGYDVTVLENFSNSSPIALDRVEHLSGRKLSVVNGDIRDESFLEEVFQGIERSNERFDLVVHLAGVKSVAESVKDPLKYWDVNLTGSQKLFAAMRTHECKNLLFSSTSTVYGNPKCFPLTENSTISPIHPYAQSKYAVENMINALAMEDEWNVGILRYFNPVGSHSSGFIGEDPLGIPNNLFPYILQVVAGKLSHLSIFGNDYPTPDGTGIRDYIHVMDLAKAHVDAVKYLLSQERTGSITLNIGTGKGLSVLDIIKGFELATGEIIPYKFVERRQGDVPRLEACPKKAKSILGWSAKRSLVDMCRDGWAWQKSNPNGYHSTD